jgi:hypothetical protein
VVLLVLAIVWGVLLVSWLRSRSESTFSDSVGTFRRHLSVLERAAPSTVAPANRLGGLPGVGRGIPSYRSAVRSTGGISGYRVGASLQQSYGQSVHPYGAPVGRRMPSQAAMRRRQAQKRRRDVFLALLAGVCGSFLLAIIPGLSIMWSVQVLFDLMTVGYVALLIRIRNLAAERELKMTSIQHRPRGRVAPARPSYDFGAPGYGELGMSRAAN